MATSEQRARWRGKVGDSAGAVWSDAEADDKFAEAAEHYPGGSNRLLMAEAVRLGVAELLADAAKRTSYTAGSTSESAGQMFDHLAKLHAQWQAEVEHLRGSALPAVRWGGFAGYAKEVEYPDA